jgi:hypothetical protein
MGIINLSYVNDAEPPIRAYSYRRQWIETASEKEEESIRP